MSWPKLNLLRQSRGISDDTDPKPLRNFLQEECSPDLLVVGLRPLRWVSMPLVAMHTAKLALERLYR